MNLLYRVLRSAMAAPGNRDRFEAAGLIDDEGDRLVDDWQPAFARLLPIAKATIRQNPGQFLATVDDIVYRGTTSGTQGQHFVYFADSEWNQARLRARRSALAMWGIHELTPIINVGSRLLPVRLGDMAMAGALSAEFIDRLLDQLATTPAVIRGYPSRLCEIAAVLAGRKLPLVLGVICTGECLFDFQTALLERVFNVPVINEYGCQESGISGLTCPQAGRLHLDSDRCLYEIIDGQLVTTDLLNVVMPMVRYQCGDVVKLHDEPCSCGRSSLTATLRGRTEDLIRTGQGKQYLGDVVMPAVPGVLRYQMIRGRLQTIIQVCPDRSQPQDLQPLINWATELGITAQLSIQEASVVPSIPVQDCDLQSWIDRVTCGAWATELNQSNLPGGKARKVAQLLHDLVNPTLMLDCGLPLLSWMLLQSSQSTPTDRSTNEIAARILLFACSFLWNDPSVEQIYHKAVQRLPSLPPGHPAHLDRLIPTLFLDTATALAIWTEWLRELDGHSASEPIDWQIDTFSIQHTLQAFESAVQRASPSPISRALRPFLSVLIGDLSFFAAQFAPWLLGYWFELLHQQPLPKSAWLEPPSGFAQDWVKWRQQLMRTPQDASLAELRAGDRSSAAQERVALEQGYRLLIQAERLDPNDWIAVLQQIGNSQSSPEAIDIVPWQPILKALVKPLHNQNQHDLAYDCLQIATVPSARISAFERLASQCNHKQPVLYDLFAQAE